GREVEFEHPDERARLDDLLLKFVVERGALLRIRLDGRFVHQLVGFGRAPARAVDEYGTRLDRLRMVKAVHADYRVGERLNPVAAELEVVVGVDAAKP